jgi:hypothetical protein
LPAKPGIVNATCWTVVAQFEFRFARRHPDGPRLYQRAENLP